MAAAVETTWSGADPDPWLVLESRLVTLARSGGVLRAAIARAAARFVSIHGAEALGYARLDDYARERLGQAGRTVYEWAQVGEALARAPRLERLLASGALPWTKVRALARLATAEEVDAWLPVAERHTAASFDREIRRVAHCAESLRDDDREPREPVSVACTPRVRAKWHYAQSLGRQVAGFGAAPGVVAEMIAAEVLSALEPDESFRVSDGDELRRALRAPSADEPPPFPGPPSPATSANPEAASRELASLLAGLADADARELDRRLRDWIAREQRLDAEIGARVAAIERRRIPLALGFPSIDAYARDRLGIDPRKAHALLAVERAAARSPELAAAYREGELSWVAAQTLRPVILADSLGRFAASWVAHARVVTVRQLRDDVERALLVFEADPTLWARTGGLPEALASAADRPEIGAQHKASGGNAGLQIGARVRTGDGSLEGTVEADGWVRLDNGGRIEPIVWKLMAEPGEREAERCSKLVTLRFLAPTSVGALFRAVLGCVQRGLATARGVPVTPSDALEAMLDHVIRVWDRRITTGHRVYERHGWRCAVPGCTSRRGLHDHHILFRSAGGDDAWQNRVALCAFHHLRGVHARLIRVTGEAPHGLRFELPLETFTSGDRRASAGVS